MTQFNQPVDSGSTDSGMVPYFSAAQHDGNLVLFQTVIEAGTEFDKMSNKDREFRIVTFVNLDTDGIAQNAKITNVALVRKLPAGATNILGRIGQTKTSNGYNAWVLNPHTPDDAAKATAWIASGGKPASTANLDPMAKLEAEAKQYGVSLDRYLILKKLSMIKEVDPTIGF